MKLYKYDGKEVNTLGDQPESPEDWELITLGYRKTKLKAIMAYIENKECKECGMFYKRSTCCPRCGGE